MRVAVLRKTVYLVQGLFTDKYKNWYSSWDFSASKSYILARLLLILECHQENYAAGSGKSQEC